MRITEFSIEKYGPLCSTGAVKTGAFSLFFGRNEKGKTLTIDALIKFLLGKKARDFKQAERVEGIPDGYLKMAFEECESGKKERTLPFDGDLPKITRTLSFPLSSSDCRNIFIIRNSDLSLSGESEFYTGITERLVGLRTSDLKKIKRNLLEIGRLTPAMDFRNDEKSIRLKSRLENAEKLIVTIENARDRLLKGNYDKLEFDLYNKSRELSNVKQMMVLYEEAGKRDTFEKGSELLDALESKIGVLKDMEIFRDEDLGLWQDSEMEVKRSEREIAGQLEKAGEVKKKLSELEDRSKDLKQRLDILSNKKRRLDDQSVNLRGIQNSMSRIEADAPLRVLLKRISIFSGIITLAIIFAWYLKFSAYIFFAGFLSLFISAVLWTYELVLNFKKRKVSREYQRIKLNLAGSGINGNTLAELLAALSAVNEDYERLRALNLEHESELTAYRRHLSEIENKIQEQRALIDNFEKRLVSIKTKSGFKTAHEYNDLLKSKRDFEKEKDALLGRLEGMLGVHGKSTGESLSIIRLKMHELEIYRERATGTVFNRKTYDDLIRRDKELEEELKGIREKNYQFEVGMAKIEADANEILIENDEKLCCKTLVDLDEILNNLRSFVEENNETRKAITAAMDIADNIGKDEDERVLELFESDSPVSVSGLFNNITNGNYQEVIYDRGNEDGILKVRRGDGEIIEAEKLSGGAYDQLYLAVRLALGEKLLYSEKGFFIMDDPFIKSDIERIRTQMNALKKINIMGWQILYFSCKNEIKDILFDDIKRGNIKLIDIDWVGN